MDERVSIVADRAWGIDLARLEAWIRAAAAELAADVQRASFELVDDRRMTALHRRHLDIDSTTDVLTFPHETEPPTGAPLPAIDVDIAICVDEAARQAARRGHDVEHEVLLYAVHGLLHCAGFDDGDVAGSTAMHAEEDRILESIGVGAVYGRGRCPEDGA